MKSARRFLFVTWPGGGNVQPFLALANLLRARGHSVSALGTNSVALKRQFENFGIGYRGAPDDELLQPVLDEVARVEPDALLVDYMLPDALCAAECTRRPYGVLVHTLYQQVAVADETPMLKAADVPEANAMLQQLGVAPVGRITDLLDRAQLVLVAASAELDRPLEPLPSNVRYVGPLLEPPEMDARWGRGPADQPLVVVSLGTTPMNEAALVQRVLDALETLAGLRVLVNLGEHLDPRDFRVPANARLTGYVRHAAVLPHAALMINHAGMGAVGAALSFGVPMLCLPIGRDQPTNAAAVAALGVGRALAPEAPVAELRRATCALLESGAVREAARLVAESLRARCGAELAVAELERLAT